MSKEHDEETVRLMQRIVERSVELAICDMPVMHNEWSRLGKDHKEEIVACVVDMGVEPLEEIVAQRDALRAKLEELREAALDMLYVISFRNLPLCAHEDCLEIAVRYCPHSGEDFCDEHAPGPGAELDDYGYAPAWRRLVAMTNEKL